MWIMGAEILKRPRWGLEKDLIDAYGEWGLSPFRHFDGARMTRDSKCFNCRRANQDYMPGKNDEQGGTCLPLQWSSVFDDHEGAGLRIPRFTIYARAKALDPELADHFFATGEFVFDAGQIDVTNARLFRFLTAMLGANVIQHLMLENFCDKCERMSPLYMGDRLKSASFRLQDVVLYEHRRGIGQVVAVPEIEREEECEPETSEELAQYLFRKKKEPDEVMWLLRQRFGKKTPLWKAAALALRKPVGDLNEFDKDKLKSLFLRQTKKFK